MDEITKGLRVEEMTLTEGWKIIEGIINEQIELGKENLLKVPLDKITSTRAKIKAYQFLLNKVKEIIDEKTKLLQEEQGK